MTFGAQRSILEARTNDEWDLRDVALDLGMTWKQALEIEEPLLAKVEAPSGGLSERARQILEQRAWRQAAETGKGSIKVHLQVEGNVIRVDGWWVRRRLELTAAENAAWLLQGEAQIRVVEEGGTEEWV